MNKRLFIAINLPANIKAKLGQLIQDLAQINQRFSIKWVDSGCLHLTLHFLGNVPVEKISAVEEAIRKIAFGQPPFHFKLGDIGTFPGLNNPRTVFVNCEEAGDQHSVDLQRGLGSALAQLGFEIDSRPWQKHITLGRVKTRCRPNLQRVRITSGEFEVSSLELMESKLSPAGPKYSIVRSFQLC